MGPEVFANANWRKSSRSNGGNNACVEVAQVPLATGVRDTKEDHLTGAARPVLIFAPTAWSTFLDIVTTD